MDREYYLKLRNRYLPSNLKTIFVSESPPASGKYFYDENGSVGEPLFKAMMKLLRIEPATKKEGLSVFQNTGHLLVDATYRPVNKLKGKARNKAILEDYGVLREDLRNLCGDNYMKIILIKANICRLLESRLKADGYNVKNNGIVVPFPSSGQQNKFALKMKKLHEREMTTPLSLSKPNGTPITMWESWTPPKKDYHWKPGRSAMELAQAWFRQDKAIPPEEFLLLLNSSPRLTGLRLLRGIPELVTLLPERGEGRNHDLWLVGQTDREQVTICIEGKADEPFGNETVLECWDRAMRRRNSGEPTRAPERIQALLEMVGQSGFLPLESLWGPVRYQLLTAICGTALQAQLDSSGLAIFVVHEFRTELTAKKNLRRNQLDFEKFLSVLSSAPISAEPDRLYGPFEVSKVECLVGKTVAGE
jgi:hypothetical protein